MQTSKLADLNSWSMTPAESLESSHQKMNINMHWDKFTRAKKEEQEGPSNIFDSDCELQNCSRRNLGNFCELATSFLAYVVYTEIIIICPYSYFCYILGHSTIQSMVGLDELISRYIWRLGRCLNILENSKEQYWYHNAQKTTPRVQRSGAMLSCKKL